MHAIYPYIYIYINILRFTILRIPIMRTIKQNALFGKNSTQYFNLDTDNYTIFSVIA